MKSAEPSTGTSKRPRGDASTTSSAMPIVEKTYVDPTVAVDPVGHEDVDPLVAPPLSIRAMMQSIMTNQAAQGQLLDELLTEVASLRVDFSDYRSSFHLLHPLEQRGSSFITLHI